MTAEFVDTNILLYAYDASAGERHERADVVIASEIAETHQLSFWDAMIIRSASRMDCTVLWSEDLNADQQISGVTVRNPFSA